MVDALCWEIDITTFPYGPENQVPIHTIYFGGGTPSLLPPSAINQLLTAIHKRFCVSEEVEITLEANPDDITAERLQQWKALGINRLSVGIQSFRESELRWMNRAHSAEEARASILLIQAAGFTNYSVDLIFGTPQVTDEQLVQDLQQLIDWRVPHLSCYALTVESGTALGYRVSKGQQPDVDADQQARQFLLVLDQLEAAGYLHYEISNYALPGQESRHNSAYWKGVPYFGIGPSAHGFRPGERRWNVANNSKYLDGAKAATLVYEQEQLSPTQVINEYLMTSLRTSGGIDRPLLESLGGPAASAYVLKQSMGHVHAGHLEIIPTGFRLTRMGKLYADGIAADLFLPEK